MEYSIFNKTKYPQQVAIRTQANGTLIDNNVQLQPNCLTTFPADVLMEDIESLAKRKLVLIEKETPAPNKPTIKPTQENVKVVSGTQPNAIKLSKSTNSKK